MGVKNLWDILESCKKTLPLHHLQNKRLCVDLSCWIIQLHTVNRSPAVANKKLYLRGLFHRLRALIALNCSVIFVTDGAIPSIKVSTYRRRLGLKVETNREDENSQTMMPLSRNMGSDFSRMIKEAKALGLALGIPCLDGMEEAEAQCASLNLASICDGCFSADSDIFLFGARTVFRDIILGDGGHVICYEMTDIEKKLGFGRNSMIALAFLLGSDYSHGVRGIGREAACNVIKSVDDDIILHRMMSEGLAMIIKTKGKKKAEKVLDPDADKENNLCHMQGGVQNPVSRNQFLRVTDAYLNPKCHPVDSEPVHRACTPHPFHRSRTQELCEQCFGWTPEQTDQYILPRFAERDLRRFAELRFASSDLGMRIPMEKLPVTCPIKAIIKRRRCVQGKQLFDVSWQDIYGLQTSSVPLDLLERACPEKILEFKENEGGAKQRRKPRTAKSARVNATQLQEVDKQLQGLLLDIEMQTSPATTTRFPSQTVGLHSSPSDIIDLSSPSPSLRAREVSMSRNTVENPVDLTVILDSEAEASPEHTRKARELRLFLDGIRKDLY